MALTDEQWVHAQSLLPSRAGPGRPARNQRGLLEALLWLYQTGAGWRALPAAYGPWQTAYSCYRRWSIDGTWPRLLAAFRTGLPEVSL